MPDEKIRRFIIDELGWQGPPDKLTDDYLLIKNHVLDSLGIYKLVTFLESEYDVEIQDEELVADNFGTIGAITRLLDSKSS